MDFPEETIQAGLKNFYADDCLKSVGTTEEAINIVHTVAYASYLRLLAFVGQSGSVMTEEYCRLLL